MPSNSKWFSHIANHGAVICLLRVSDSSRFYKWILFFVNFYTQKVKIVMKKQNLMHLSVINSKIKIFCDFWVFFLSLIPKNENSEITEILQKHHNTEIWECSFKKQLKCGSNYSKLKMVHRYFSNCFLPFLFREGEIFPFFHFLPLSLKLMKPFTPMANFGDF